jgi:hypothetical protein
VEERGAQIAAVEDMVDDSAGGVSWGSGHGKEGRELA